MRITWKQIHELEVREDYPKAIATLEERLLQHPVDHEVVTRLGFNLWYAAVEAARMGKELPTDKYAARFIELLDIYRSKMEGSADFCWAFGLGISLFWFEFPPSDEELGEGLLRRARELDSFYDRMDFPEIGVRFKGRGIFSAYYAIAEPGSGPWADPG